MESSGFTSRGAQLLQRVAADAQARGCEIVTGRQVLGPLGIGPDASKPTSIECYDRVIEDLQTLSLSFLSARALDEAGMEAEAEAADHEAHLLLDQFITRYGEIYTHTDDDAYDGPEEYLEIWEVIDGVEGEHAEIGDGVSDVVEEFVEAARLASLDGQRVEVYSIYHPHRSLGECECVQFLTDHRPAHIFIGGKEVEQP